MVHAMKAQRRSRGIAPLSLTLGARRKAVVSVTLWQFYPRERTPVPIDVGAVWTPEPVWTFGDEKITDLDSSSGPSRT